MLRIDRIRNAELGELAGILNRVGGAPWCTDLDGCLADLEQNRDIPEERCEACTIGWLLGEGDV